MEGQKGTRTVRMWPWGWDHELVVVTWASMGCVRAVLELAVSTVSPCCASPHGGLSVPVPKVSVPQRCGTRVAVTQTGPPALPNLLGTTQTHFPSRTAVPMGTVWRQPPHPVPLCCCPHGATPTQPCPFSLPAQTLGLAGAQTTQLLLEPPWRPAVLWDMVTLTCQGLGTADDTTWYKDGQRWGQKGGDHFTVTESGTYMCETPDTGLSSPVTVSNELVVLQVPARALLEGDTVTLRCRNRENKQLTDVYFYREEEQLKGPHDGTELSLSPLQLGHSGRYRCEAWVLSQWSKSELVTVTVHRVPLSDVSLSAQPPGGQVALGDSLVLSCEAATGIGSLSFSWHREGLGALLGTGPRLELQHLGYNDSGQYRCRVSNGDSVAESDPLNVTVLVPVANATITLSPPSHQVHAGDPVTLHCSVQVGSAPVTFTWLWNGQEVAQGPLLELRDIDVGHSGTYQCVATNQLGQDGHRVFRALSPELVLAVTLQGNCNKAARKNQERVPPDPQDPPEEGQVLYTHVVVTKRAGVSPRATTLQDPQVTYAELRGHQGRPREPGDIYGNVL
ncbi:Fc receptor-like protein 2 isoform X3 [Haemorhous mexicanus]|uniref:Fc receptor-like protein 2 isoform X3 n=1 Tax=Haemorhous mexicanus TaxID=30427 RepID=UPI0028BEFC4C|nr:Fc receptor-like protein 2 isoform X3 [Haemorhous mexicanus]